MTSPAAPQRPHRIPPSGQPLITKHLSAWWALAVGLVTTLAFVATDHMWRATGALSGTLLLCALLRARLPVERAGGLVVRRPWIDVATLVFFGVAVAALGFTLDLHARP